MDYALKHSTSLKHLKKINSQIQGKQFHEHTHILWDIRTMLGDGVKTYCEIGSYVGSSACLMLSHFLETEVHCIDPLNLHPSHYGAQAPQRTILEDNIRKICPGKTATIHQNFSGDLSLLESIDFPIDILFIDGDHTYRAVVADFTNYSHFVRSGGYVIFDDYNDSQHSPDVKKAVDAIVDTIQMQKSGWEIIGDLTNYQNAFPQVTISNALNEFVLRKL